MLWKEFMTHEKKSMTWPSLSKSIETMARSLLSFLEVMNISLSPGIFLRSMPRATPRAWTKEIFQVLCLMVPANTLLERKAGTMTEKEREINSFSRHHT
jgi:hypothetical protein